MSSLSPDEQSSTSTSSCLTQDQKDRIKRNREIALERQKQRAQDVELEFLIQMENEYRSSSSQQPLGEAVDKSFGEEPKAKKPKLKESQLMTDMKTVCSEGSIVRIQGTKVIDTGGGFLIEESDLIEAEEEEKLVTVHPTPAAFIPSDTPNCEECQLPFSDSFLLLNFDHPVCDSCK